jgi:hypothetical protein
LSAATNRGAELFSPSATAAVSRLRTQLAPISRAANSSILKAIADTNLAPHRLTCSWLEAGDAPIVAS